MNLDSERPKDRRRARALVAALLAAALLAALPAAGHAAVTILGSDLKKPADMIDAHGADAAFWNPFIDGIPQALPADGQITSVRLKGSVLDSPSRRRNPDPLDPQIHFQTYHPLDGGRIRVSLSTAAFRLPIVTVGRTDTDILKGDPQQISEYKPVNLCVEKGDYVAFNDYGGHEWSWGNFDGMHVQIFSELSPGSTTNFFTKNGGTNNGAVFGPQEVKQGQEVLMQYKLATGPDATEFCPGGYKQHIFKGLDVKPETVDMSVSKRTVRLHATCPWPTLGSCKGVLVLKATIKGAPVTLGGEPFNVRNGYNAGIEVTLSSKNAQLVKKAGGVTATVAANSRDNPKDDRRAKPGVPVQRKATAASVRIRPR
jgi:hypothetical protein